MYHSVRVVLPLLLAIRGADAQAPIAVSLVPVVPSPGVNLQWSPKGATVALHHQAGALLGNFALGPTGTRTIAVKLSKTPGADHYNTLWIDLDRDGKWSDAERLGTTPNEVRGKWWSSFEAVIMIPYSTGGSTRPYPVSLWYVEDPVEPDAAPALRWSRRGWHRGTVDIGGRPVWVLITELEMDGVFDQRDAWAMSRDSTAILKADVRKLDEHAWVDGIAYRPVKIDPDGRSLALVSIVPGSTEAEEVAKKDIYLPDRDVPRAAQPLPFGTELPAVLAQAQRERKRVLLDFVAVWCGPCHIMDQLVFTASAVVHAATGVIPVKVDGDEHRDFKKKYHVDGYPTVILLDSAGKEVRRGVGYQSVIDMVTLLRP